MKSLAPNSLIQNRYLIVHLIGKGGMGEVYLAVDQRLGSAVALKRTFFADDEMLGNAFEREARILARLRHPVLPKVSDHFTENGEQYLIMEHIAGEDLAKRLETAQKPFPLSWVLFWADQLLDALAYLHTHEPPIIHRDIKPQNLKLTDENHIILLDFGLSKNTTGLTNVSGSSGSTGSVVGYTPHYAPMEQIRGTGTNPRSDIYSLSATLYQLMSNSVPADALTRADALLNGDPDPIKPLYELNPEIPREISDVVLNGLEVSQERRFPDAKSMQKALRKAYSDMQEAMSAQTIVYNTPVDASPKIEQPAAGSYPSRSQPEDTNGADSEATRPKSSQGISVPIPTEAPGQETIRYNGPIDSAPAMTPVDSTPRQADIKTEVYSAGNSPFAPEIAPPPIEPTPQETPAAAPAQDWGATANVSGWNAPAPAETWSTPAPADNWPSTPAETGEGSQPADATVANISFDSAPPATPFDATENYATAASAADANAHAFSSDAVSQPYQPAPAVSVAAPKKKGSSKAIWVVGALAVLFIVGLGTAGAGWFVYTNYYAAAVSPSPSPEPTLAATPTPAPTFEANTGLDSNSSTAQVDTNSNTNVFVEPTPQPTIETVNREDNPNPRNTPQVEVKKTPVKPPSNQTASKPTPKTTPNKPVILQ